MHLGRHISPLEVQNHQTTGKQTDLFPYLYQLMRDTLTKDIQTIDDFDHDTDHYITTKQRLEQLDNLATVLDSYFRVPGTQVRFGLDSILGLVPGFGAMVTLVPAAIQLSMGTQMGARHTVMAHIAFNKTLDLVLGGIPIVGDVFDVYFKANRRNYALLHAEFIRISRQRLPAQ